jgi:hypothetical protein
MMRERERGTEGFLLAVPVELTSVVVEGEVVEAVVVKEEPKLKCPKVKGMTKTHSCTKLVCTSVAQQGYT